jgi:hypothetical protein
MRFDVFLSFVIILCSAHVNATPVKNGDDCCAAFSAKQSVSNNITLPKLINLSFSSNNIDVTSGQQWIDITIVYEAESEPASAYIKLTPPEGIPSSHTKGVDFFRESWKLNDETNTYSSTIKLTFDKTDASGGWIASLPHATDGFGNTVSTAVDTSELIALGVNPIIHLTNPMLSISPLQS